MDGLKEWHHSNNAGFQLVLNEVHAGHGCLTLIVSDIETELKRLNAVGVRTGETMMGDIAIISQLSDPDGNTVVLAQPSGS